MARSTGKRNEWTLSLPDIQRDDRVLEVGCGPGALIQALAAKTTAGSVVGIDLSPTMLQQASKRNAQAIREGWARLEGGSATALPFEEASFDKALSANSVPFWPDQVAGVREMRRVLRPGAISLSSSSPTGPGRRARSNRSAWGSSHCSPKSVSNRPD